MRLRLSCLRRVVALFPPGAAAGSIDQLDEQLRVSVEALLHPSPPPKPYPSLMGFLGHRYIAGLCRVCGVTCSTSPSPMIVFRALILSLRIVRLFGVGWQLSILDQLKEERALRCSWVV